MLSKVVSAAVVGLSATPVDVEVDISSQGLPSFTIVGLPDKAVEESKERVRAAIKNTGADFPAKRITVNLAPAHLPKEGPAYDLPIALGYLLVSDQIKFDPEKKLFAGELALDGSLRPISGILSIVIEAKKRGFETVFIPKTNTAEASLVRDIEIIGVNNLVEIFEHLENAFHFQYIILFLFNF